MRKSVLYGQTGFGLPAEKLENQVLSFGEKDAVCKKARHRLEDEKRGQPTRRMVQRPNSGIKADLSLFNLSVPSKTMQEQVNKVGLTS